MPTSIKYKVVGIDAVTGKTRQIEVEADCEKDALLWAREIGILTSGIKPTYTPFDGPSISVESAVLVPAVQTHLPISSRPKNANPAAAIVVVGFFAIIFLVCSGVLNSSSSSSSSDHSYTPAANIPPVQDSAPYSPGVQDAARKWGVSDDRMQHAIDQIQSAEDYRIKNHVPDPRNSP